MSTTSYRYSDVFPVYVEFEEGKAYGLARQHRGYEVMLLAVCMSSELHGALQVRLDTKKPFHLLITVREHLRSNLYQDSDLVAVHEPLNRKFIESFTALWAVLPTLDTEIRMTKQAFTELISAYDHYQFGRFGYNLAYDLPEYALTFTDPHSDIFYSLDSHPIKFLPDDYLFKVEAFDRKLSIPADDTFLDSRTDLDKRLPNLLFSHHD